MPKLSPISCSVPHFIEKLKNKSLKSAYVNLICRLSSWGGAVPPQAGRSLLPFPLCRGILGKFLFFGMIKGGGVNIFLQNISFPVKAVNSSLFYQIL